MKLKTLRALIDAGLTNDQIMSVIGTSKQQDTGSAPDPADSNKETKGPEAAGTGNDDIQKQILNAITGLTATIQASNIKGAVNKEPETIDDIMESMLTDE